MTLKTGTRLGEYEIVEPLGKGGMGEVYSARDLTLLRKVAIKVLPEKVANDPNHLSRFEREARLLASLNHPNIAMIHGLEHSEGIHFLVLELVPGKSLAERIRIKPLSLSEALPVFRQIAEGLEAAHENGVIHRDLKPGNIMVTADQKVKILDFGLAKAFKPDSAQLIEESNAPTAAFHATETGLVFGTAPYMSPEQLRGKVVDRRTDIWAFGCVVYEVLTGRMPFRGDSVSDTVAAILNAEPDWQELPSGTPAFLRRLIRRCLQKDAHNRLQSIGDARVEIEEALAHPQEPGTERVAVSSRTPITQKVMMWVATGIIVLLASLLLWRWNGKGREYRVHPSVQLMRLTDSEGLEEFPAVSPDGKSVAFTADVGGNRQIWVRLLGGGPPLQITHDLSDHLYPRWSSDSASILYYAPSKTESHGVIFEVSALGGSPRRIIDSIGGADLSHKGDQIAFFRFHDGQVELVVASRNGADPHTLARLDPAVNYSYIRWSPDDQLLGYQRGYVFNWGIFVVPARGGEPRSVYKDENLLNGFCWLPDGKGILCSTSRGSTVLYLPTFNLWTADLDGSSSKQLTFGETSYFHPDLNGNRTLVADRMRMRFDIWKYPTDGTPEENVNRAVRITQQTGEVQTPSVSPGDREIAYLSDSGGHGNIWVKNLESGDVRQITFERDPNVSVGVPVWSPDGKNISFVKRVPGEFDAEGWLTTPDGSNIRQVEKHDGWAAWSGDSRWLYYGVTNQGVWHLNKVSMAGGAPIVVRPENVQAPAIAPDGSAIFFTRYLANVNGSTDQEIRVARPETGPAQVIGRIAGSRIPIWQLIHPVISPDGQWLAMPLSDEGVTNIWAMPAAGGPFRQITDFGKRRTFIARRVSWSSDGRFIFAALGEGDSDVVQLSGLVQ